MSEEKGETNFANAKVGDRCYSPMFMSINPGDKTNVTICSIARKDDKNDRIYLSPDIEIKGVNGLWFTPDGGYYNFGGQVLFWENPIKEIPVRPKRKVIKKGFIGVIPTKNGSYLANTTNIHASQVAIAEILPNCKHQIIPVEFEVYE